MPDSYDVRKRRPAYARRSFRTITEPAGWLGRANRAQPRDVPLLGRPRSALVTRRAWAGDTPELRPDMNDAVAGVTDMIEARQKHI